MTKTEARRRIRDHVLNRGDDFDFHVTPTFVLYWWRICNKALFNGELPTPKNVIIRNFRDEVYGYCEPANYTTSDVVLGIRSDVDSRRCFLTVLIHEMVHQWEYVNIGRMSHGKNFYAWEKRVNRYFGLNLNEYITDEDE